MDFAATADQIRSGKKPTFDDSSLEFAQSLDKADPLKEFRNEYIFPTKTSLKSKSLQSKSGNKRKSRSSTCMQIG